MNNTKSDIASFSTRFFRDIRSQILSKEVIRPFNCDSYISKRVIFIPVHKNHNHWFVVRIFLLSKVILAVDSLKGDNTSDISIVINFFQKYLKYHLTVDCGVHMLLNIYGVINEQLAIESLANIQALRCWIGAEILNAKNESIYIHKEVLD